MFANFVNFAKITFMNELVYKFSLLSPIARKEILDMMDFLLAKKHSSVPRPGGFKQKISRVSVWTEDDISQMKENAKEMNKWEPEKW